MKSIALLYADNGDICGSDPMEVQEITNQVIEYFNKYGMEPNPSKNKYLISHPPEDNTGQSVRRYNVDSETELEFDFVCECTI